MIQVIRRDKSNQERLAEQFARTGNAIGEAYQRRKFERKEQEADEAFNKAFPEYKGIAKDLRGTVVTEKLREKEFNRKQTTKE